MARHSKQKHNRTKQGNTPSEDHPAALVGGAGELIAHGNGLDARVLVLNRLYVAVRVVTVRRAFAMLCRDMAEIISVEDGQYVNYDFATWTEVSEFRRAYERDQHDWVRTVRTEIAVPRIIRLFGYDKLPTQRVKLNRRNLFARDRSQCQYCGSHFTTSELTLDHVTPRTQGGGDTWENLVCACVRCNARKGGRTPEQARMKLIRKPVRPRRNPLITLRLGNEKYRSWKAFLDEAYWSVELR
ncbi:MAG: HNH endonuclease [Planctomycetota bacterium]|nr:HNH endonuclease [Planctomycetota bacterium]